MSIWPMPSPYQIPDVDVSERPIIRRILGKALTKKLLEFRNDSNYRRSAFKRALRTIDERHSYIALRGKIELPDDFQYDETAAAPRGNKYQGEFYSSGYQTSLEDLPQSIKNEILKLQSVIECYLCDETLVNELNWWRNLHVPEVVGEIYSDNFHQDLVIDQYNMQLMILLHDTSEKQGPFEFLNKNSSNVKLNSHKKRDKKQTDGAVHKLTGQRGDYLLFSSGTSLHRASSPALGQQRDIVSIGFFPSYTGLGSPLNRL